MIPRQLAMIVRRGHQDTYDLLRQEFVPKGVSVIWDRRFAERRRQMRAVAADRRAKQRRQEAERWNVQHFRVVVLEESPLAR